MGWKGTVRSINAELRRMEREAEKRHKAAVKEQKISDAASAVEEWEEYIAKLVSVHVDLSDAIDWEELSKRKKPIEPKANRIYENEAELALNMFKPKFFDFLSGGSEKKRTKLQIRLKESIEQDKRKFILAKAEHTESVIEWQEDLKLSKELLAGKTSAINKVLSELQTFSEDDLIGSRVRFILNKNTLHAIPEVHGNEIIPDYRRKQLASGSLSQTKMPKGDFNDLYQDYVASVALKVAGDTFHLLPIEEVYVTCVTSMLNSQTGHQELTPILSVQFLKPTFSKLNLLGIDPSDSLNNFNHNMKFKRTKGFEKIESLQKME